MARFRKKPVEIEAREFNADTGQELAGWCGGRYVEDAKPGDYTYVSRTLRIPTLEGVMTAQLGDWIIRGVHGEFYPCKPDIFKATYEAV